MNIIETQNRERFKQLDALCQTVTPYLKGGLAPFDSTMLVGESSDLTVIKHLYGAIELAHPEAGHAYWLTRTWELLCWQPIYISVISIYGLQALPAFDGFAQQREDAYIMGYRFQTLDFITDEIPNLVSSAGIQLTHMFEHYRLLIDSWLRCRPGFTRQILADALLESLVKLRVARPDIDNQTLYRHAELWLSSCGLPLNNLRSYSESKDGSLRFVRRSCCLVYKTEQGQLCSNCPRKRERICTS